MARLSNVLRVGDPVISRFGHTTVTKIELCEKPGEKYGIKMNRVFYSDLSRCVIDTADGKWQYGDQLDFITI